MSKSNTVEYRAYIDAKSRCSNKNHKRFKDWGDRGIEFRFNSFKAFFDVVGERPPGGSLERIDNNGHYEVGNIRWATKTEQQHNKRLAKRNKTGICGVRVVKAPGLVTTTYQAHTNVDNKFIQLYCGDDFFLACCARKSFDSKFKDIVNYV